MKTANCSTTILPRVAVLAGVLLPMLSVGCRRAADENPPQLRWLEADASGDVAVVGGDVPQYRPPPYVDLRALEIAMSSSSLPESPDFLVGTRWVCDEPPPGEPQFLQFLGNMLTISQRDGRTTTVVADYSAVHPRCHGYPLCITTLNTNGALSINFLHLRGNELRFAECMDFAPNPPLTDEQLAEAGATRVWSQGAVVCFVYDRGAVYTPDYARVGEENEPSDPDPVEASGEMPPSSP